MKICQGAWKSLSHLIYRGEAQGEGDWREHSGKRKKDDFEMFLFRCFQGEDLPHLDCEFLIQILYKLFSFSEPLSIYLQTPTQTLQFEQWQYYLSPPLGICCSPLIMPKQSELSQDSCWTPHFSVVMPCSFRTSKSSLRKLEQNMSVKNTGTSFHF